jgi:hypothetical protein
MASINKKYGLEYYTDGIDGYNEMYYPYTDKYDLKFELWLDPDGNMQVSYQIYDCKKR